MIGIVESPGLPRGFVFSAAAGECIDIRPIGLMTGSVAAAACGRGLGRALAGGPIAFTAGEIFLAGRDAVHVCVAPLPELTEWARSEGGGVEASVAAALERLTGRRPPFAGLTLDRPRIVGVVNVTPDSFSDGGDFADPQIAAAYGKSLFEAGADMIEIGGESSRPGARETPADEELERVLPVVRALTAAAIPVAVDTRRAVVMAAVLEAGAAVVNDITALGDDAAAPACVAGHGGAAILMHMQGRPRTMQDDPIYAHAPYEILRFLKRRVAACEAAGIPRSRLAVDPGIGFGKTDTHNLQVLGSAALFHGLGCAVVVGASRKSFIGRLADEPSPKARLPGSIAALAMAVSQGVQLHRVHDVAETRQALAVLAPGLAGTADRLNL